MNNKIKNELIKRYKLIKDRKVFDINDIEYSSKNKADDKNIVIKDGSLSDVIHTFVDTLVANFDEDELATFYNNIKTLAIEITDFDETIRKRKYESSHKTLAYYKIATNTIYILDTSNTGILYHELFHVSTARRVGTTSFNGFCQTNLLTSECIGEGINEGYTQLMAERYFKDSSVGNYNVLVYLVELLELIIGKDKMEHYYMTSDLYSLVNELKKSNQKIPEFLEEFDFSSYNYQFYNSEITPYNENIEYEKNGDENGDKNDMLKKSMGFEKYDNKGYGYERYNRNAYNNYNNYRGRGYKNHYNRGYYYKFKRNNEYNGNYHRGNDNWRK